MPWITKEGRNVDEARDAAVAASGMLTDELEIEVVHEGAKGLFGLGGEPAVVRVRPRTEAQDYRSAFQDDITPAPGTVAERPAARATYEAPDDDADEAAYQDHAGEVDADEPSAEPEEDAEEVRERQEAAAALGVEIIGGILERMEIEGEITTRVSGGTVYIEISGEEMGILIGRNGATLEALQEVVRAGIQRRLKSRQAVVVDIESYWERRRAAKSERRPRSGSGGGGSGGRSSGGGRSRSRGRRRGGRRGGQGGQGERSNEDAGGASESQS